MCKVSRNVSITSWNVNGLFKKSTSQKLCKLDDNNFSKYMQSDIICLSETHAHSKDILQYVGYKCYMNCRDNNSKKPSGGLATFIKRNIVHGIQLIDKSYRYVTVQT